MFAYLLTLEAEHATVCGLPEAAGAPQVSAVLSLTTTFRFTFHAPSVKS
jgi:hypothetical protein